MSRIDCENIQAKTKLIRFTFKFFEQSILDISDKYKIKFVH